MSRSHGLFQKTGSLQPGRNMFNLSYAKKFDATFGLLYVGQVDEVIPGDTWHMGNNSVVRLVNPALAPLMENWTLYTHSFFVPYRLLDKSWEKFITGGWSGNDVVPPLTVNLSKISGNSTVVGSDARGKTTETVQQWFKSVGGLFDILGFNPEMIRNSFVTTGDNPDSDVKISAYPFLAVPFVWNEFFRDENYMDPVYFPWVYAGDTLATERIAYKDTYEEKGQRTAIPIDTSPMFSAGLPYRCWKKDYFTSALPWQQRGDSPSLPLTGLGSVTFDNADSNNKLDVTLETLGLNKDVYNPQISSSSYNSTPLMSPANSTSLAITHSGTSKTEALTNHFNFEEATTFTIADLRLAVQIQKWMERNARAGSRYTEELRAHFGICPKDERLQRPEYLGGSKSPIVISEVLQTSESTENGTGQGNLAGHALGVSSNHTVDYTVSEFGLILTFVSIMPTANYHQGINRQWLRETRFDYPWPEFVGLSEQEVTNKEICVNTDGTINADLKPDAKFGYQGRYDELRYKPSMVCGNVRPSNGSTTYYDYWTMTRHFDSVPTMSAEFLRCQPNTNGLFFSDENPFVINFGNIIHATRPLPAMSNPGLLDHF